MDDLPDTDEPGERRSRAAVGAGARRDRRVRPVEGVPSPAPPPEIDVPWPTPSRPPAADRAEPAPTPRRRRRAEATPPAERRRAGDGTTRSAQPARDRPLTSEEGDTRVSRVERRRDGSRVLEVKVGQPVPRVDRELFRPPSGRRASAGRVLGVGLVCFGLWTAFDANQLYHNALSSPVGTRRTVSIEVLRPIAAVMNALDLSGPVNAANTLLGRGGATTAATLPPPPPQPAYGGGRPPNDIDQFGLAPRPHTRRGQNGSKYTGSRTGVWPPPLRQPTPAHPLVMLDIGDSIGEDLGFGLGDLFANDPYVRVIQKGVVDTGLARPSYYNWPAALNAEIAKFHPGAVVMMLGANDDSALELPNGGSVPLGTLSWVRLYRHRVSLLMNEATASGAHVIWVGLPPVQNSAVNPGFAALVNSIVQSEASTHSGVTFVSSWSLLSGPHGKFVQYKSVDGSVQQIRYSDGVHLAPVGWDLLASYLLSPMERVWHLDLHATPLYHVTPPAPKGR